MFENNDRPGDIMEKNSIRGPSKRRVKNMFENNDCPGDIMEKTVFLWPKYLR